MLMASVVCALFKIVFRPGGPSTASRLGGVGAVGG
jgi:hypothetical protein